MPQQVREEGLERRRDGRAVSQYTEVSMINPLDINHFECCLNTLDRGLALYQTAAADSLDADMYRSVCVKEFELLVEVVGKLLKKKLRPYFASNRDADKLTYKAVIRHAARYGLLPFEVAERWLAYRDIRNRTAREYGADYANEAVAVLPTFAADTHAVQQALLT